MMPSMENNIKMYALSHYTYDYYEWEETFAVSFDPAKLEELASTHTDEHNPLVSEVEHEDKRREERGHYTISEIRFLP
jgi:hypothetical protein